MKTKKLVAIFLTAVMAASAMNVTAFAGQASDSTESLKIVMKPGDLTANGSRIDTPWLNRSMGNNLMFRALFIATNSDLTEVNWMDDNFSYGEKRIYIFKTGNICKGL